MARFADRTAAGCELAALVRSRGVTGRTVVLGLPRGGVPLAACVAAELRAPLDILVVRKLRTPGHAELAFGAVASGDVQWLSDRNRVPDDVAEAEIAREQRGVRDIESRCRPGGFVSPPIAGREVVLVDDGIATGSTVRAAVEAVRRRDAASVIVAAPIAPPDAVEMLALVADRVDIVETRARFRAVSALYADFGEVDEQVVRRALADQPPSTSSRMCSG